MNANTPVVVRRSPLKKTYKGKSGGAWKVAFADFTLAMMAFFMVLWILEVSSVKERQQIANYMRTHSVFDGSPSMFEPGNSPFPVDLGGSPSIVDHGASNRLPPDNPAPGMSEFLQIPDGEQSPNAGQGEALNSQLVGEFSTPSELGMLLTAFEQVARDQLAQANIEVDIVPSGLRVIIRDDEHNHMFKRGQESITPFFEDLLFSLGAVFRQVQNAVIISGHTDATRFNGHQYGNWELSGNRAQQARKILVAGGMPTERVAQVAAFSSRKLLDAQQPDNSANRRIELLVLTPAANQQLNDLFSVGPGSAVSEAAGDARMNQPVSRLEAMQ